VYNPDDDKFTTDHYGLGINTKRIEGFAKIGYVFPEKKYQSIGLQLSAFDHQQDSYFGLTAYNAKQNNLYANLIYQSIIGSTAHKFRTGLSFVSDKYNEDFKSINFKRTETVPGAFFEYTFTPVEKFNIVAGLRADHNSLYGWFATPRLHVRYEPVKGTTIRFSAGRGQRTANIFAENMSVFVSSRQINILSASTGKAYGLDPEVAWNKGISVDQKLKLFDRDALVSVDYFRNDFDKQVVVDLEDARQVKFYDLAGKSFSNSFQAEMSFEPVRKLEVRLAYRFFDVRTTYGSMLLQKPLTAKHRAFTNLAYEISGWKFDYTFNYNGTKRIPGTSANPVQYQRNTSSPSYVLMNAQVSKTLGKKHPFELYFGGENLTNYFQKDPIIAADQPFSTYFDAALVWGPVSGRLIYAGVRYKLK
jgi:outer membrane receptor for ferrienterochelin and colicin